MMLRLRNQCRWLLLLALSCAQTSSQTSNSANQNTILVTPAEMAFQKERGQALYFKNCFICHQFNGQGIPGVDPPLAKSDFLTADRDRAIRILCEGTSGEIQVNGRRFNNVMPVIALNDQELADVLTYVLNSWGNAGSAPSALEVKAIRAKTQFPTFESQLAASTFAALPVTPAGFNLREVVRLPDHGVRMASTEGGKILYVLCQGGDVWRLEVATGQLRLMLRAKDYLERRPGDIGGPLFVLGMALDPKKRLYIASNQQNNSTPPVQNIVTIYRTTATGDGDPAEPKPWFQISYPGNSAYVHGMEHIAFGPDGFLYAGNGARTDGNQLNTDTNYFQGGEIPLTSSIWRLDPRATKPEIEVFARGIRNAYGFCWNGQGEMFATENGPDADAPEELNFIERGKHYGFPYTFANWGTRKAYPTTPDPPPELKFTLPIANLGPDGGFDGQPMYTFDPHSSPGGIVWLGNDFPEGYRGTFLMTRFGNFIRTPKDNVGFDLLQVRLQKNNQNIYEAHIHTILAPLGRPIDVQLGGPGQVFICEYSRPTNNAASYSLPGRILELSVKSDMKTK